MTVPTLLQLIEEYDSKAAEVRIIVGGAILPKVSNLTYQFRVGESPVAQISVPGRIWMPLAVQEEAAVQIWFGYRRGFIFQEKLVFGGAIVDSISASGTGFVINCVMDGPRKLSYSYNRRISYDFDNVFAEDSVIALLDLAGVVNYSVNLDPWVIGTVVPYTAALGNQLQFSSYGEAVNKVAEVDGTPWYAMPSGQVRVENRDPIPSASYRRTYFSSVLTGINESQPIGISNSAARPRINDLNSDSRRDEVANFIVVDGAVVTTIGPNGEQNSEQITETVDGLSGQFPNGARWIPTPPLFQDYTFSNELIDTNAKAFEVAERYYDLKNRLFQYIDLQVPGDPDVFLGETVRVIDRYSRTESLYFVQGYSTSIDDGTCTTTLNLVGGPESGTTGFASPFAEFYWLYQVLHTITGGGSQNFFGINLGPGANQAGKLCEDVPGEDQDDPDHTDDPFNDARMVIIGLDGSASQDFDGFITDWDWTWIDQSDVEHSFSGVRQILMINPDLQTSVQVTLTVTDNSGRTDSITKTIYTDADHIDAPDGGDPTQNDTKDGGGVTAGPCTEFPPFPENPYFEPPSDGPGGCEGMGLGYYVAAEEYAMGSVDNRIWNDLARGDVPVNGLFISVASAANNSTGKTYALFGTDQGELVLSDDICESGEVVFTVPGGGAIECIWFDTQMMGIPAQGNDFGDEGGPDSNIVIPVYTEGSPGTLTIVQAYQQCLKVGFSPASAVVAVAIMIRESGLYSHATNTIGNTPPSTDRGICQWNDFYHPDISDACAYNTECAITKMYQKSYGGTDFSPWKVAGGTPLTGTNPSVVQQAVGFEGSYSQEEQAAASNQVPRAMGIWLGTSNGRIYRSEDSGRTWSLWVDFGDGFPVKAIATPSGGSLWVYGGNTSDIDTLVRIDPHKTGQFVPLAIHGDLRDAIVAAGAGNTCAAAASNNTSLLLAFDGGVDPPVWISNDPIGTPDGWVPAQGLSGGVVAAAPGFDGEYIVA